MRVWLIGNVQQQTSWTRYNMRKVFIDGGANVGQSIEAFCNHYPNAEEFEIHSFEASQSPNVLDPLNTIVGAFRDKVKISIVKKIKKM